MNVIPTREIEALREACHELKAALFATQPFRGVLRFDAWLIRRLSSRVRARGNQ